MFRNNFTLYGEGWLVARPMPKLEDHPLLAARDCLFNIFAAGGRLLHPLPEDAPCSGDKGPVCTFAHFAVRVRARWTE
jgi:hypothetical protein